MGRLLGIDHHQRFAFAAPKDARIVETGNVHIGAKFAFALLCRCWRHAESDRRIYTPHATRWSYVVKIILCTWYFAIPSIATIAHVTDVGLTEDVLLMVPIRHDSAHDEILVFGPIGKRYDGRIPEDSCILAHGVRRYFRDVVDDVWKSNMVGISVGPHRTFKQDSEVGIEYWL